MKCCAWCIYYFCRGGGAWFPSDKEGGARDAYGFYSIDIQLDIYIFRMGRILLSCNISVIPHMYIEVCSCGRSHPWYPPLSPLIPGGWRTDNSAVLPQKVQCREPCAVSGKGVLRSRRAPARTGTVH